MFVGTAREKFFYHNTLLCLVKSLQDRNITIDLRNDSCVCGCITIVDGHMNITMKNAVYCDPQGNEFSFENLFVQGRSIRYIHIPDDVQIIQTLNKELRTNKRKDSAEKPTMKSRKAKKALKQHLQTVASLDI